MTARTRLAGIIALSLVFGGAGGCSGQVPARLDTPPVIPEPLAVPESHDFRPLDGEPARAATPPAIPEPLAVPESHDFCPLDGEPAGAAQIARRILAVVLDNHPRSRPQAGLAQACLVFEVPVEGGITRFLAMYLCSEAPVLLPIRSVRPYFLDWVAELDAVIAYCGGSSEALRDIARLGIAGLDEIGRGRAYFERRPGRYAPYNLESSTLRLRQGMADFGLAYEGGRKPSGLFRFASVPGRSGEPARALRMTYSRLNVVEYWYDEVKGNYRRFQNGKAHTCATDPSLQVTARTVLVMEVETRQIPGSTEGHLELGIVGGGRARVFSRGMVSELRWAKQDRTSPTVFTLTDGSDLVLEPGPIWVHIVPLGFEVEIHRGPPTSPTRTGGRQ